MDSVKITMALSLSMHGNYKNNRFQCTTKDAACNTTKSSSIIKQYYQRLIVIIWENILIKAYSHIPSFSYSFVHIPSHIPLFPYFFAHENPFFHPKLQIQILSNGKAEVKPRISKRTHFRSVDPKEKIQRQNN